MSIENRIYDAALVYEQIAWLNSNFTEIHVIQKK